MSFPSALVKAVGKLPYTGSFLDQIRVTRRRVGSLCIDKYLGDLSPLYPPADVAAMLELIEKIEDSEDLQSLKEKPLIYYYIFLCYPLMEGSSLSDHYAQEVILPQNERDYVEALYEFDQLNLENGLAHLATDIDIPDEINSWILRAIGEDPFLLQCFLDSHSVKFSMDILTLYVKSHCSRELYFSVLDLARDMTKYKTAILELLGDHAAELETKESLTRFIQVPYTNDEWAIIWSRISQGPASKLNLTRSLLLGDTIGIVCAKADPAAYSLTKGYDDF